MRRESCFKCCMMKTITCKQLRQMIADILSVSIDEIRAAKEDQFFYEFNMPPTDNEVDEFIISSSCFDDEMKKFFVGEVGSLIMEDEWRKNLEKMFCSLEFFI